MVLTEDEELIAAGATQWIMTSPNYWYEKISETSEYDFSAVSTRKIDAMCAWSAEHPGTHLVIEIEKFDLVNDFENASLQLATAALRWKSNQPDRLLGYYRIIPERNLQVPATLYDSVITGPVKLWSKRLDEYRLWQARNDRVAARLLPLVDFLVPSIYIFPRHTDHLWRVYADANLSEALRVCGGKPVYPIIMPSMHPGQTQLDPATWQMMIDYIVAYPGVSGLAIHSSPNLQCDPLWREPIKKLLAED